MLLYNIDFFNFKLTNIHHDIVDNLSIDNDYLSPSESTIEIPKTNKVDTHDIIYIKDLDDYLGIITKVSSKDYTTEISFKPFISLFDHDAVIDVRCQGAGSNAKPLETVIKETIMQYWMGSDAGVQNLSNILSEPVTTSSTTWRMGLKADSEKGYYCTVGFYETLIAKALSKYRISIKPEIDFFEKKITLNIGTQSGSSIIEADLDNIIVETFTIKEASSSTNTLEVWHEGIPKSRYKDPPTRTYYKHKDGSWSTDSNDKIKQDEQVEETVEVTPSKSQTFVAAADAKMNEIVSGGTTATTLIIKLSWGSNGHLWKEHYYLHSNGSYSTNSNERILPGVLQVSHVDIDDEETFNQAAADEANNVFSGIEWTNLIELSMDINDKMVNPTKKKLGQLITIYKDNIGYASILTGTKMTSDTMTLVFGTVRHDLTKKLKK